MKNIIAIHNLRLFKSEVMGINADLDTLIIFIYVKHDPHVFKFQFSDNRTLIEKYKSLEMQMMETE